MSCSWSNIAAVNREPSPAGTSSSTARARHRWITSRTRGMSSCCAGRTSKVPRLDSRHRRLVFEDSAQLKDSNVGLVAEALQTLGCHERGAAVGWLRDFPEGRGGACPVGAGLAAPPWAFARCHCRQRSWCSPCLPASVVAVAWARLGPGPTFLLRPVSGRRRGRVSRPAAVLDVPGGPRAAPFCITQAPAAQVARPAGRR
jgi:hypothetical protein